MSNGDDPVQAALKVLADTGKRYIPESDLMASKKGLEGQVADLQTQLANAKTELDTKHTTLLTETAAKDSAVAKLQDTTKLQEEVKNLTGQLKDATTSRDQVKLTLVDLRRLGISNRSDGKVPMEELKGKTEEQLVALEEALNIVNPDGGKGGQKFDGGTGGSGSKTPASGRGLIKQGLSDRKR